MEIVSPSGRSGAASLLQSGYGNYQIGPLKNLHQLVEDALIVMGARLKVFVKYALSFAEGVKSQLLICHRFLPIQMPWWRLQRKMADQVLFWTYPIKFYFSEEQDISASVLER